jgi:DnaJ family protein A protein 2
MIAEKDKCKKCKGEKTVKEKKTLEVFVSKGMKNGERIAFSGEADEAPETTPGDVIVVLQQQEHHTFKRDGPNLFLKKSITLLEALTGFHFSVTHLDGRTLLIRSEDGGVVKPGDVKAVRDEGMPQHKNPYVKGSLYVEFDVEFPAPGSLTPEAKRVLASVLPKADTSMEETNGNVGEGVEEVTLQTVDIHAERQKFEQQHKEAYEEDDDTGGRHQAGCRTQ